MGAPGIMHPSPEGVYGAWEQGVFIGKLLLLWCFVGVLLLGFVFCCINADDEIAQTHVHSLMSRANKKRVVARATGQFKLD
jgi:hypothetical protein